MTPLVPLMVNQASYIPPGNYSINSTINIPSEVIIESAGSDSTHLINNSSGYIFSVAGNNVRLTDLDLSGPNNYYARLLKNVNFYSSSRKAKISTTGIY